MTYRDPLAGLRSQVAVKRAVLEDRERELTPVLRALLPEALTEHLAALRARAGVDAASLETLADADAALDGLLAACDEALAQSARHRWCAESAGDPPRPWIEPPWLFEEAHHLAFRKAIDGRLSLIDGEPLVRWGDRGYRSRVRIDDFQALCFAELEADEGTTSFTSLLRVSVPETLGRIMLCPQGRLQTVGKAIGLAREIETGDEAFDARFWITGAAATAVLLTERARRELLALRGARLRLSIGHGFATLTWGGAWRNVGRDALPPEALAIMSAIREAIARG